MKQYTNERPVPVSGVIPAAVIAAGLTSPVAWSGPGDLDPAFGDVGRAELPQDLSGAIWALEAIGDKYQVAGGVDYCGYYNEFCGVDDEPAFATSLSGTGVADPTYLPAITKYMPYPHFAWQGNGRLIGVSRDPNLAGNPYRIFRLANDGSLDPTFGTGGTVTTDPLTINSVLGVAVDPDGRIVIDGTQGNNSVLVRLMPDGRSDPAFGTNGVVVRQPAGTQTTYPLGDIVRTPDGAYRTLASVGRACHVYGVTASGNVDNGFGNAGSVDLATIVGASFRCSDLDVLPNGKILVAGQNDSGGTVVRLSADGALDATFTTNAGSYLARISAAAISAGGSVFVAGPDRAGLPGTVVARLLPDGRVDTGFGTEGKAWVDVQSGIGSFAEARALAAPNDEHVLVAGGLLGQHGDSRPFLARLTMSGAGPGVVGIRTTAVLAQESERQATIVVRRTGGSTGAVSVGYRTELPTSFGPAATAGADFEAARGRLEWASGETGDKTIVVPILGDQVDYEGSEHLVVTLEEPLGGGLGRSAGLVTIAGDGYPHGAFRIFAATPQVKEQDSTAAFYVSRTDGGAGAVSVTIQTVPGTAAQGTDFELQGPATLSWPDGQMSDQVVNVRITRDRNAESDETFSMKLSSPTGGAVIVPDAAAATVTIQDSASSAGRRSGGGMAGLMSLLLLGLGALVRLRSTAVPRSVGSEIK